MRRATIDEHGYVCCVECRCRALRVIHPFWSRLRRDVDRPGGTVTLECSQCGTRQRHQRRPARDDEAA